MVKNNILKVPTARSLYIFLCCLFPVTTLSQENRGGVNEQQYHLTIKEHAILGDFTSLQVQQGKTIRLFWETDQATFLHLHGYDIELSLRPNIGSEMTFKAHATGRFPITSHVFDEHSDAHHKREVTLLYLEVHPN